MQQRHTLPSGRTVTLPSDATPDEVMQVLEAEDAKDRAGASPATAVAAAPPRARTNPYELIANKGMELSGRAAAGIRNLPTLSAFGNFGKEVVAAPFDMMANPRQHAPDLLATGAVMAAAPFTGGMSIPAGVAARGGAAATAGILGSLVRGDKGGDIPLEGLKQLLMQLVPDGLMNAAARPARSMSRAATNSALRPSEDILNMMRGPGGTRLANFKDRADVFAEGALDRGGTFSPASSGYHKEIKAVGDAVRADKVGKLTASTEQVSNQDILDAAAPQAKVLAEKYGTRGVSGEAQSLGSVPDAISDILSRSTPAHGPLRSGDIFPPMAQLDGPWSMMDVDAKMQGLQKNLARPFTQQTNAAATRRGAGATDINTDVDMLMRDALSGITERVPGVAEDNAIIAANIPFETAAHDATMPSWGELLPRPRVALNKTAVPDVSLFGYAKRRGAGAIARPLRSLSENAPTIGRNSAQLARLISMLMQKDAQVSAPMNAPGVGR